MLKFWKKKKSPTLTRKEALHLVDLISAEDGSWSHELETYISVVLDAEQSAQLLPAVDKYRKAVQTLERAKRRAKAGQGPWEWVQVASWMTSRAILDLGFIIRRWVKD